MSVQVPFPPEVSGTADDRMRRAENSRFRGLSSRVSCCLGPTLVPTIRPFVPSYRSSIGIAGPSGFGIGLFSRSQGVHMRATIRVCACLLALIAGAAVEGRAQGFQGGIRGAVKDAGGVIPGAEVTLTNQGNALSRTTTTNAAGEYSLPEPGARHVPAADRAPGLQGLRTGRHSGRHAAVHHARHHARRRRRGRNGHRLRPVGDHRDVERVHRHRVECRSAADACRLRDARRS